MKITLKLVLGSLALAIVSGLIVNWLWRKLNSPRHQGAQQAAWCCYLTCSGLPNLNCSPQSPASAYPLGAPVTNFRPYLRVGQMEVASQ